MRAFISWVRQASCAIWAEFTRNPKVYALLWGQPVLLLVMIWLAHVVAQPRWGQPLEQLDILKLLIVALAITHAIIAIAMAAVRVSGRGPGGVELEVSGDDEPAHAHVEGDVTIDGGRQ